MARGRLLVPIDSPQVEASCVLLAEHGRTNSDIAIFHQDYYPLVLKMQC
jgi:hypothetical protein